MGIRPVRFCSGPLMLEGRFADAESPLRAGVVLSHPHPSHRGSMSSALIPALQRLLARSGYAALRFNFRGVGKSEGSFDEGRGETDDAVAALDLVVAELPPATPLVSVGWSFGSLVALRAAMRHPRVAAAVAIAPPFGRPRVAPPVDANDVRAWGRPVLVIGGERDDIAPVDGARAWTQHAGASLAVISGADHFFRSPDRVAESILAFLRERGVG